MSRDLRGKLRRLAPVKAKNLVYSARRLIGQPPIDDAVLAEYCFLPDPVQGARLNLVMPNLSDTTEFGGVSTGIDAFLALFAKLKAHRAVDIRLILTDKDRSTNPEIFTARARDAGIECAQISVEQLISSDAQIAVRKDDLFITYNWWTTLNIEPLLDRQAGHFGVPRKPLIYFIQEYEPAIFPLSSGHMLAREAYDTPRRLWGIFNSSQLKSYFDLQGHNTERSWTFEPVVNDRLRSHLDRLDTRGREKRIVIYGRPTVNRNCFPALVRGLRAWATRYPQFDDWQIVSAGTPHDPIALGNGRAIEPLGKLSLDEYAELMMKSAVGVCLMASPHPSYPPLEMAHFGMRVVTNSYTCKDLSGFHPNLTSIPSIAAGPLADAIAAACQLSDGEPDLSHNASFVRPDKFPFMEDCALHLSGEITENA